MKLILNKPHDYKYSLDAAVEFEKIIVTETNAKTIPRFKKQISNMAFNFWRLLYRIGIPHTPLELIMPHHRKSGDNKKNYFAVLMGADFRQCLPFFMLPVRKNIYMFDAWPNVHDRIIQFANHFKIDHVFISSFQAAERLNNFGGKSQFHWVPEGINPDEYIHLGYHEKDIDVLSFGRQYDAYHDKICSSLESAGKIYIYPKTPYENEKPIFPTRESFISGLARSKVSVCVPSSITNPQRSGDIETMTIRYLQSMVSKTLIVGHAPEELIEIFGYNPVIEIDMENAGTQILKILSEYADYHDYIEKNYSTVLQNHTWWHRWQMISNTLNK
jgi:hypothetical protein